MVTIHIKTWGCTANKDNEAIMAGLLLQEGNTLVKTDEEAEVVIFNTCTVKGPTQNRIIEELKQLHEKFPEKRILISGCMVGAQEHMLKSINQNVSLVNTMHLTEIPTTVAKLMQGEFVSLTKKRYENKANLPKVYTEKGIATIQISQGCADVCYFCITKLSQGFVKSFPIESIKQELQTAVSRGIKMIYLTSQDNGAYGIDKTGKSELVSLLKELIMVEGDFQIRVGMTNPRHIIPIQQELVQIYKNPKIIKFLHIPVQAGSNKVLEEMNRKHSVEDFEEIVALFRKEIPGISISTDIICGYPTETDQDFEETISLLKELQPEVVNISQFTSRPGTKAAGMKQLPSQTIKERTKILTEVYHSLRLVA